MNSESYDTSSDRQRNKKERWRFLFILLIFICIAFILRYSFINDYGFTVDEANEVLIHRELDLNNPHEWLRQYEIIHLVLLKGAFFIGGGESELAARLPSLVFGLATIGVAMILALRMFNHTIACLTGVFLTFSHWHIKWSIMSRPYSLLMLLGILTCLILEMITKEYSDLFPDHRTKDLAKDSASSAPHDHKSKLYRGSLLALLMVVIVLALGVSRFGLVLVPIVIVYVLVTPLHKNLPIRIMIILLLILTIGGAGYFLATGSVGHVYEEISGQWWGSTFASFYYGILVLGLGPAAGVLSIIGALTIVVPEVLHRKNPQPIIRKAIGMETLGKLTKQYSTIILLVFGGIFFIFLSTIFVSKFDRYLTVIIPEAFILVAAGIIGVAATFKQRKYKQIFIIALIAAVLLPEAVTFGTVVTSEESYRANYTLEWREACDIVKPHLQASDIIVTSQPSPVRYYLNRRGLDAGEPNTWEGNIKPVLTNPGLRHNRTIWVIIDKGHYQKTLTLTQRECIETNTVKFWESNHNLVFRSPP